MAQKIISSLTIYPIKSTNNVPMQESHVYAEGLAYDRRWAIIDADNRVITAREYPRLLHIRTSIAGGALHMILPGSGTCTIPLEPQHKDLVPVTLFDTPVNGNQLSRDADQLLSGFLGAGCRLIFQDDGCVRNIKPVYGGKPGDTVSYADSAPVMLVSEESLKHLNSLMREEISMRNFRPNIVVAGCEPDEEDGWRMIRIGGVLFEVNEMCRRCVFATIDPETKLKHQDQEPLRTLATYKRHPRGGVSFGVTLIPKGTGTIRTGDTIEVMQ